MRNEELEMRNQELSFPAEQGKQAEQKPSGANLSPDKDKAPTMGKDTPLVSPKMLYGGMRK